MLTPTELWTLDVGTEIQMGSPLQGLAPEERLVFVLKRADHSKGLFTFEVFYFGNIWLGEWVAKIQDTGDFNLDTGEVEEKVVWQQNTRLN